MLVMGATAGCAGSPIEQANELIDRFEGTMLQSIEVLRGELEYFEELYESADPECGDAGNLISFQARVRYARQRETLRSLQEPTQTAIRSCSAAQRRAANTIRNVRAAMEQLTEEAIGRRANQLRGEIGRLDSVAIGIILDNAESAEGAWRSLMEAMGHAGMAGSLTEEQMETAAQEDRTRFEEAIQEMEAAQEQRAAALRELEPIVAEIETGTWVPPTNP